ncbi:hypothetical protein FI667_g7497, partial [Globisporangium splendens]
MAAFLPTTTIATTMVPPELKCSYRSKPCPNIRATKMNGDFHKLCEYHRRRANLNQQRVHQRRKLRELDEMAAKGERISFDSNGSDIEYDLEFDFECEPSPSPCGDLPLPDLKILELLLSDNQALDAQAQSGSRSSFFELSPLDV